MTRVFVHVDFVAWLQNASKYMPIARKKCLFALQQLLTGQVGRFRAMTAGANKLWRRSALGGSGGKQFYLFWAPCGVIKQIAARNGQTVDCVTGDIIVRGVYHHDVVVKNNVVVAPDAHFGKYVELTAEFIDNFQRPGPTGRTGVRTSRGVYQPSAPDVATASSTETLLSTDFPTTAPDFTALISERDYDAPLPLPVFVPETVTASTSESPVVIAGRHTSVAPLEVQNALLDMTDHFKRYEMASLIGVQGGTLSKWINGEMGIDQRHWPVIVEVGSNPAASRVRLDAERTAHEQSFQRSFQQALVALLNKMSVDEIARGAELDRLVVGRWLLDATADDEQMRAVIALAERVERRRPKKHTTSRSSRTTHRRSKHAHKGRKH